MTSKNMRTRRILKVKVVRVRYDACKGMYMADLSDGTENVVECCNCILPPCYELSSLFLNLHDNSKTPVVPSGIAVRRLTRSSRDSEFVSGACWSDDCIAFATTTLSLQPVVAKHDIVCDPYLFARFLHVIVATLLFFLVYWFCA